MKTKEELNALKSEVEALNEKLAELTEEELVQVSGGLVPGIPSEPGLEPPVIELPDLDPPGFEDPGLKYAPY